MVQKIATRISEVSANWRGRAFVYKIQDPTKKEAPFHVVASSIYSIISGPETMVFESDESGHVPEHSELNSIRTLDPDLAIEGISKGPCKVVSPPLGTLTLTNFVPLWSGLVKPGNLIQFTAHRLQLLAIEGSWNPNNLEQEEERDFFSQMDKIDSSYCLLLTQPKYEKDFNLIVIEILKGEKIFTVLAENRKENQFGILDPSGETGLFKVVK